jgi:hypothetical protein
MENEEKYASISKKHEAKHGHFMTPNYEKAINSLEALKLERLNELENKIKTLNSKKENDNELKRMKGRVDSLQRKISHAAGKCFVQYNNGVVRYSHPGS